MKGMHEIFLFALLMKFLVAVKSIKRWDFICEKVRGTLGIKFSRRASDKEPLLPFSFYSICYLNVRLSNIFHYDLQVMIISSENVFQSFEHTVLLKLKNTQQKFISLNVTQHHKLAPVMQTDPNIKHKNDVQKMTCSMRSGFEHRFNQSKKKNE